MERFWSTPHAPDVNNYGTSMLQLDGGCFCTTGKIYTAGAAVGSVLAVANFAALSISIEKSVEVFDQKENPAGAKMSVQLYSTVRMLVIAAIIFVLLRVGVGEPVAMILPLLFTRIGTLVMSWTTKERKQ